MKAVLYTRVSTEDQKENGFSLREQEQRLRKYCASQGIEVIAHYQDDHSAKNFNRPDFQRFISDVKGKKIKPDLFLCVRPDRFSRNMMESLIMMQQFRSWGIAYRTLENNTEVKTPEDRIMEMLHMLLPEIDNERRGLNTKVGMRQAAREGRWVWRAPIGYRNEPATKTIVIDEAVAPLVKEAFEVYAKGIYTAEEVRLMLRKKGFRCCKNNFLNTLYNRFYTGKFVLPAWNDEPDQIIQGQYEPLISEELYNHVQDLLRGKRKAISISSTRRDELPLRGFLECKQCGHKLTGSGSRSRDGSIHYYYHCQHGCKERFRADEANRNFALFLDDIAVPQEVMKLYHAILKDVFGTDTAKQEKEAKRVTGQIEQLEKRISSLEDKFIDDAIDADLYTEKRKQYKSELAHLHTEQKGMAESG